MYLEIYEPSGSSPSKSHHSDKMQVINEPNDESDSISTINLDETMENSRRTIPDSPESCTKHSICMDQNDEVVYICY